jgi:glycosyltransferase involved in cell wall biosynthesis
MDKLRILSPDALLPETFGGYIRTMNIAKLLLNVFQEIEVLAVHENYSYDGFIDGIRVIQNKKFKHPFERFHYYLNAFFSKDLVIPEKSFHNASQFLFQLESPYFYHEIKKAGIKEFVLNEFNITWEMERFHFDDLRVDTYHKLFRERNKIVEIKALKDASLILVCSDTDREKILVELPDLPTEIITIPNCINFKDFQTFFKETRNCNLGSDESIVTFVGTLNYPPNRDAAKIIVSHIAPHFTNEVKFLIVGKNPPKIKTPSNVHFLGYVDNVKDIIQKSDICIAPLRFGSGTRLKILEYMAMKKPIISTSKGAEGLDVRNGEHIILEDNLDLFHKQITTLLNDKRKMRIIGANGQKLVEEKYDWKLYQEILEREYSKLI